MKNLSIQRALTFMLSSTLLVVFATVSRAQSQKINSKRPAVYLTFKEFVKKGSSQEPVGARLVLHNNTRWTVHYGTWLEPSLPGDVAMIYAIESEEGCSQAPAKHHIDVVTGGKLLPGKNVSFTVPLEDFTAYSKIFIEFDYSWELVNEERVRHEAVHRAYFLAIDLPRRETR